MLKLAQLMCCVVLNTTCSCHMSGVDLKVIQEVAKNCFVT